MNAIKMFLAALAALVCFPAYADGTNTVDTATADTATSVTPGLPVLILHPSSTSGVLACRRSRINPSALEHWKAQPVEKFTPALAFDASCPSDTEEKGMVFNFHPLHGEKSGVVSATAEGAVLYIGSHVQFRQDIRKFSW